MPPVHAEEYFATEVAARALIVSVAQAYGNDPQRIIEEINGKNPNWVKGDLYPMIYTFLGKALAHGQQEKMVGKNLIDLKDINGNPYIRTRIACLRANPEKTCVDDYTFRDPVTGNMIPKRVYCKATKPESAGGVIICSGIYLRGEDVKK